MVVTTTKCTGNILRRCIFCSFMLYHTNLFLKENLLMTKKILIYVPWNIVLKNVVGVLARAFLGTTPAVLQRT